MHAKGICNLVIRFAEGFMTARVRPYLFYDVAVSICSSCHRKVEGKIVFENDKVLLLKWCPETR